RRRLHRAAPLGAARAAPSRPGSRGSVGSRWRASYSWVFAGRAPNSGCDPCARCGSSPRTPEGIVTTRDDGAFAALAWLRERDPAATSNDRWYVEIALDVIASSAAYEFDDATATRFHLDIYREEWGVWFCHRGRSSRIVCSDAIRVLGADHYNL